MVLEKMMVWSEGDHDSRVKRSCSSEGYGGKGDAVGFCFGREESVGSLGWERRLGF